MKHYSKKLLHSALCVWLVLIVSVQAAALSGCSNSSSGLLQEAKNLYAQGEVEDAEYKLMLYIEDNPSDYDALILMGDWFTTDGDDRATDYYVKAAKAKSYDENSLNVLNLSTKLSGGGISFTVKPAAKYTKSMTVSTSGDVFRVDKNSENGTINGGSELLTESDMKTTQWFSVNPDEQSLVAFGNMNCAVWQFADEDGGIKFYDSEGSYNLSGSIRFSNLAYSQVDIPSGAVKARLTYYDPSMENTLQNLNDGVYVQYGTFAQGYKSVSLQTFELPDLEGDDYIEYKNGVWTLNSNGEQTELDLGAISDSIRYLQVSGTLVGELNYSASGAESETSADKSKEYGIRYKSGSTVYVCQRTGDAADMSFNYKIDDEWAQNGENDFDSAYPWCDIKRCNVNVTSSGTAITYEGEDGYAEDGSNGNVMVEIPKFYVKRVIDENGYEEISISGEKHDGYVLDPAFVSSSGDELEHIYVGAYLSGGNSTEVLTSVSGSYPSIKLGYSSITSMSEQNGSGFGEIDYAAYSALQKLFIVETGNINSSSIFSGVTGDYYFFDDEEKSGYALTDADSTNTVTLASNSYTQRFAQGDSVALFASWDDYQNNVYYQREIVSLTTDKNAKTITVEFSGDPIKVTAGETAITNIPTKCGKTDDLDYCTAEASMGDGKSPFKYRGIENLYGAVAQLLDGAYVLDSTFTYLTADGEEHEVNAEMIAQNSGFSDVENLVQNLCIKSMLYDEENPTVMLPSQLGSGAGATSAYGDYWYSYKSTEGNSIAKRYIVAGGAEDNFTLSGLFQMRSMVNPESDGSSYTYIGSRLMYRPTE